MPEQTISKLMMATEPADAATLTMIECLRQIADGNKSLNQVLVTMQAEIRDVRERLIRIEASEFKQELTTARAEIETLRKEDLSKLDQRVDMLERDQSRRDGAMGLVDWTFKNWPGVIGFIALITVLVVSSEVNP